ncbi:MAG: serine protease [Planctomycetota bacterium]
MSYDILNATKCVLFAVLTFLAIDARYASALEMLSADEAVELVPDEALTVDYDAVLKSNAGLPVIDIKAAQGTIEAQIGPEDLVAKALSDNDLRSSLPLEVELSRRGESVNLESIDYAVKADWERFKSNVDLENESIAGYAAAMQSLSDLLDSEAEVDREQLLDALDAAQNQAAYAHKQLAESEQTELRKSLCAQFVSLVDSEKATFGRADLYAPMVYSQIYMNSQSCVGIVQDGKKKPHASGVLIGKNLILTAAHAFRDVPAGDCEVWFDFEESGPNRIAHSAYPIKKVVFEGLRHRITNKRMDFVLVEIGLDTENNAASATPSFLDSMVAPRDTPIYVVGHPGGERQTIHDNAFVLYPYRVSKWGLEKLRMIICAESGTLEERERRLAELNASYRWDELSEMFILLSRRWDDHPTISADCDTSKSVSGGPAYSRETNGVIGILFRGEYDSKAPYQASWRRHEAIVPVQAMLEQLDDPQQGLKNWRSKYQVRVVPE